MSAVSDGTSTDQTERLDIGIGPRATRIFGWSIVTSAFVYFINNFLTVWLEWPGPSAVFTGGDGAGLSVLQVALYGIGIAFTVAWTVLRPRSLRDESASIAAIANYIIKVAFWSVVLVGLSDALISFLRVENLLHLFVGDKLTTELGRSHFRGPYVHFPLIILSFLIAARAKTLGFQWLALLVVVAELFIVLSRFVFSYEQAFQGDLVRFWYGALFLFASAYTLFEDGHVRVDVIYTGFSPKAKGLVNMLGSIFLGLSLCWTVFIFGMWDKSSIINSALLAFEVSQSGFGMYVKFWMAGFLAIFALSMAVQFASYFVESAADYRGDPGRREPPPAGGH